MFRRKAAPETPQPAETGLDVLRAAQELSGAKDTKALLQIALTQALEVAAKANRGYAVVREGMDRIVAVKGYGPELLDLELAGPWMDGEAKISTNPNGDLFQPNLPEVRARLAAAGMRELRSSMVVPLRASGEVRGALVLDNYSGDAFSPTALEQCTRWAGVVGPQFELVREMGRYRNLSWGLTHAFVEAIEAQDFAQLGHAHRVTTYCTAIAREMGFTNAEIRDLWFGAMLHDLGKLLRRELGPAEHASLGYNLLSSVADLDAARQGILHHHERWDGTGGPHGLEGNRIPMPARVIAVANAYDHLTSERGDLLNNKEALEKMRTLAGTELDPNLVAVLERVLSQGKTTGELRPEGLFPAS